MALEGAHASVIGGAPAAAVVFAREVDARTGRNPRVAGLDARIAAAEGVERQRLRAERGAVWDEVQAEKLGELADEFDAVHSVERAVRVGSVSEIIAPETMRPFLIGALDEGVERTLGRLAATDGRSELADPIAR